jgi:protein-S-isoprenylcysteine O-methyltransferase Ste14
MAEKRLSRFGIGPLIAVPSVICTLAALAAGQKWPDVFILDWLPPAVRVIGGVSLASCVILWLAGVVTVMRAYDRDQLVTRGAFAVVRHPVYGSWITLGLPGLALLTGSWPMLLTPAIAYAIFKRCIRREDQYLEQRFGQAYLEYRRRVNEVVPIPRFWK